MRASSYQGGLDITLYLADKEKGEKKKRIEYVMPEWQKPRLVVHIVRNVPNSWYQLGEESGFHVTAKPRNASPKERTRYDVWLSEERFHNLTNPKEDPISMGGYFPSRCRFDRVDIKYFAV
ncbi:hypothetical protein J4233_01375 [Candidatus Pacearchaeota archaeon]|nr:hypothetical protein [Candidatus Pacearchaeota archaeon]